MLLIWKRLGILIPVFAIGGGIVGSIVERTMTGEAHSKSTVGLGIGMIVGAWICALTVCKTRYEQGIDFATGKPISVKVDHTFWFINATVWAIIVTTFGLSMAVGPQSRSSVPRSTSAAHPTRSLR